MKSVFRVTTTKINLKTGSPVFINFECTYSTLDLLVSDLNDGVVVIGEALFTRKTDEEKVFEVIARRPYAFARGGVGSVEIPDARYVEFEDEVAA